jgi:hypothetical protein
MSAPKRKPTKKVTVTAEPMVTGESLLSIQVCVPAEWTNEQVQSFMRRHPCGTTGGWRMREGGAHERVKCKGADARKGYVHVMGDC